MLLASLFAKNPFTPLREHMRKTLECVDALDSLFDAMLASDQAQVREVSRKISQLEHEADLIKHEIRARLSTSVFLPVNRREVLDILHHLDSIADAAEDLGVLLTMRPMELPAPLRDPFTELRRRVDSTVRRSGDTMAAMDQLLESGFSGKDAAAALRLVDEVSRLEHEADKAQDVFAKALFAHEDDLKPAALFMWIKIGEKLGELANCSERMTNLLRVILAR